MDDPTEDRPRPETVGNQPPFIRTGSVFVRAVHLLAASAVAGPFLLGLGETDTRAWWLAVVSSGALLLAAEVSRHHELYRELAGWSTILKLVLIGCIPAVPSASAWLMAAAFVMAVLGAHLPRRWRHRRLF